MELRPTFTGLLVGFGQVSPAAFQFKLPPANSLPRPFVFQLGLTAIRVCCRMAYVPVLAPHRRGGHRLRKEWQLHRRVVQLRSWRLLWRM